MYKNLKIVTYCVQLKYYLRIAFCNWSISCCLNKEFNVWEKHSKGNLVPLRAILYYVRQNICECLEVIHRY